MSAAVTSGPDTMRLARDERADLADLADFLATPTPEQWDAPTLCTRWRVRDAVAHMFSDEDLGLLALVRRFAAARFNADRVNALGVAAYADHRPVDLLARVREHLKPSGLPARGHPVGSSLGRGPYSSLHDSATIGSAGVIATGIAQEADHDG